VIADEDIQELRTFWVVVMGGTGYLRGSELWCGVVNMHVAWQTFGKSVVKVVWMYRGLFLLTVRSITWHVLDRPFPMSSCLPRGV
jgi:hypothetical protein